MRLTMMSVIHVRRAVLFICFKIFNQTLAHGSIQLESFILTQVPVFQFQRKMSKSTALQTFSLTNNILEVPPQDEIYRFDADANRKFNQEMPWTKE